MHFGRLPRTIEGDLAQRVIRAAHGVRHAGGGHRLGLVHVKGRDTVHRADLDVVGSELAAEQTFETERLVVSSSTLEVGRDVGDERPLRGGCRLAPGQAQKQHRRNRCVSRIHV